MGPPSGAARAPTGGRAVRRDRFGKRVAVKPDERRARDRAPQRRRRAATPSGTARARRWRRAPPPSPTVPRPRCRRATRRRTELRRAHGLQKPELQEDAVDAPAGHDEGGVQRRSLPDWTPRPDKWFTPTSPPSPGNLLVRARLVRLPWRRRRPTGGLGDPTAGACSRPSASREMGHEPKWSARSKRRAQVHRPRRPHRLAA